MAVATEQILWSGLKGFMFLSQAVIGLSHLTADLSPGTRWKVNPFKVFYHSVLLADKVVPVHRLMNYPHH